MPPTVAPRPAFCYFRKLRNLRQGKHLQQKSKNNESRTQTAPPGVPFAPPAPSFRFRNNREVERAARSPTPPLARPVSYPTRCFISSFSCVSLKPGSHLSPTWATARLRCVHPVTSVPDPSAPDRWASGPPATQPRRARGCGRTFVYQPPGLAASEWDDPHRVLPGCRLPWRRRHLVI